MVESKKEYAYRFIKDRITQGAYRSQELLNEQVIAAELNVSKTPVREALGILTQQGYLKKTPRVGYCVRELTINEHIDLFHLRYILECGIIRYVIGFCSDEEILSLNDFAVSKGQDYESYSAENVEFHMAFAELTKNKFIVDQMRSIFDLNSRWISAYFYERVYEDPHARHRELVDYLLRRDVKEAIAWEGREMIWADGNMPYFIPPQVYDVFESSGVMSTP